MYTRRMGSATTDTRSCGIGIERAAPPEADDRDEHEFFDCVRREQWPLAFELLCLRYCDFMLGIARRYEVPGGVNTACDIVQEYLLALFRGFIEDRFTPPSHHLRHYLAMGLHRTGIACWRRESSRPAPGSLSEFDPGEFEPVDPEPERRSERHERVVLLAKALTRLPPKELETLHLRCVERLDHAGIAARLGIPVASVRTHLHRAKATLRVALKEVHHDRHRFLARDLEPTHDGGDPARDRAGESPPSIESIRRA